MTGKKLTEQEVKERCIAAFGIDKFNYDNSHYKDSSSNMTILCLMCNQTFEQRLTHHLRRGLCTNCFPSKNKELSASTFKIKGKEKHNDAYGYNKSIYINSYTNIEIYCKKCNKYFWQRPDTHLNGGGCRDCAGNNKPNTSEWIEKAKPVAKKYGWNHNYDLVDYDGASKKVKIICLEEGHGEFETTPNSYLSGKNGCKKCQTQYAGEVAVEQFLKENNITYEPQKRFDDCRGIRNKLPFDAFAQKYNTLIEFDGEGHYMPICFNGASQEHAEKAYKDAFITDSIKTNYAKEKGINLIRIPYWDFEYIDFILEFEFFTRPNLRK